ncbi:MAG: dihydrolipoyl dehydrogenase [Vulcanimicrobiota bacterium]
MSEKNTNVLVLGGGPGGYAAAFMAADLGLDVTLVDQAENPGGVCLYRGCIPSKALLHAAKVITEAREAAEIGLDFGTPKIDRDKLAGWKEKVVQQLTGGLGQLRKARKVEFLQGTGKFVDANTLEVEGEGRVRFQHAIIATGSRPIVPGPLQLDSPKVMDSTAALVLEDIPERLLVIGGGYIGLELGTVYSALGSQVTVVEMMDGLLPGADRDLVKVLEKRVRSLFSEVLLKTRVTDIVETLRGLKVSMEPEREEIYDKVLVSVGRRPNTEGFGLENTGVKLDEHGFVAIDRQCRTNVEHIYAIGDVSGQPMLAHRASHQGRLAAQVINGSKAIFDPHAIPAVVFTDPELAWCGLTEEEAAQKGIEIEVARFPWGASGRALTLGRGEGLTKLILEPRTERVLGMGIVGPGAGELIAEGALAVEMAAVAEDLALTIHAHPTLSETVMESAEVFFGTSTHVARPKSKR